MKTITKIIIPILTVFIFMECGSSRKAGDPGGFDGTYMVGGTEAIVFSIYEAYEVEFQMFGDPVLFFFESQNAEGKFVYKSDDGNYSFVMEPGNQKGTFYEINEPPVEVIREE